MNRRLFRPAALAAALLLAAACDGDDPVNPGAGPARLRVFNAVVSPAASPTEVRVDSSAAPGAAAVPQSTGTAFAEIDAGTYRFEARLAGGARDLFGGSARVVMAGGFGYTLLAVGTVPQSGTPNVAPVLVADDPFPPSRTPDGGGYHARIQVVNAAPYADGTATGALVQAYVTEGGAPAGIGDLAPAFAIGYRNASTPLELPAGRYTVTVARLNGAVVARQTIDLGAGHARTLVLTSTEATASPSPANHRIVVLADRDF